MRVLVLSCATYSDPATRKVWERVAARGVEVTLAMPRKTRHPFGPEYVPDTPWPTPGVQLVRLDTWYLHLNGTHIIMKGLPRLLRETRPDIIHCVMEPWSLTCLEVLALIAGRRHKPKFGVQAAETRLDQGTLLAKTLRKRLFRLVVSRCDFFIGWSPLVLEAAKRLGLDGQPACAVPAVGVDTALFRPAAPEEKARIRRELALAAPEEFLVGFVGRFVEEKGVMDLVAAVEAAVRAAPQVRLALLGEGPLSSRLTAIAAERPWLHLSPRTDRPGVASFLRALDLLVLPSRSTPNVEEQFGLVIAEAMACGVPVAGAACGAIPHVIGDDLLIFPQENPDAIRRCILNELENPLAAAAAGRSAGRRSVSRFADSVLANQFIEIWSAAS